MEISHLAGARRGRSGFISGNRLRLGSDPEADICVGPGAGVLACHAEIECEDGEVLLRPVGAVRIDGRRVGDVLLRDGDVLEIGEETRVRVRLHPEAGARAETFHAALAGATGGARGLPLPAGGRSQGRVGLAVTVLLLAPLLGGVLLASRRAPHKSLEQSLAREREQSRAVLRAQQAGYEKRIEVLRGQLAGLEARMADRNEVDRRVGEVQRAVARVETSVLDKVDSEVERSLGARPELQAARDAVERIERGDVAAERIIAKYAASVCLIQGAYGFAKEVDGKWRFLREASPELLGEMPSEDKVPLTLEGDGPVFSVEYTGTGFLVDAAGIVLTNRHIAQPWWRNDAALPLLEDGYAPRFIHLRAWFPGRTQPVAFERERTLLSDEADLAALRFEPQANMPHPVPLAQPREVAAGRSIVLLGYPSGLDALIARSGDDFTDALERDGETEPDALLAALAGRALVRPLPTQGHIGDVLEDKIVYDAATAVGGSGGPVLDMQGRVVAVNYGILKAFRGANFGVPVAYARTLLTRARAATKK